MGVKHRQKNPPRIVFCVVYAHGEGETEDAFLHYINSLNRNKNTKVRISHSNGGGPTTVITEALRLMGNIEFDDAFILLDTDREWPESLKKRAGANKIRLIGCSPLCIEGFFIHLFEPKKKLDSLTVREIKTYFHKNYLSASQKVSPKSYKKIFPTSKLNKLRQTSRTLNQIMTVILDTKKAPK